MGCCYEYCCERGRRVYLCQSFLFSLLPLLTVLLIVLFWNDSHHPFQPKVFVEAASLAGFHPGGRGNDSHLYDLALNVSFTSPHIGRHQEFCYDAIEGRAYHGDQELGYNCPPTFCQRLGNRTFVSLAFSGRADPMAGGLAESVGWFVGDVKMHVRGRIMYHVRKRREYIQDDLVDGVVECRVEVPLPSHGNASGWLQRTRCHEKFHSA